MNEPIQDAEIVPPNALAVRQLQPQPIAEPLWGTSDQSAILAKATATANSLKDVVKSRGLISNIQGKEYPRCEAWTLLGSLLGVFPVLCWTKQVENGWEARVEAKTLSGAIVGAAEAQCCRNERNWNNRDDFALRSMAQTRATAKALRMPLGFIMTLAGYQATPAEEMEHERTPRTPKQTEFQATKPTTPRFKSVEELLEASKSKLLKQLREQGLLLPAWAFAVSAGIIMENEKLDAANASRLFVSADLKGTVEAALKSVATDHGAIMKEVQRSKEALEKNASLKTQMHSQFDAVYGPPGASTAEPEPPAKMAGARTTQSDEEWFWEVIISIPRKGQKKAEYEKNPDTIGSLYNALKNGDDYARSRLFGLANDWECKPREYNGKTYPPSEGDKATRKGLDAFLEWEENKAKEGCDDAREAVEDDEPPF